MRPPATPSLRIGLGLARMAPLSSQPTLESSFSAEAGRESEAPPEPGTTGQFSASPIAANGFIYLVNTSGTFAVLRAGDTLDVAAVNKLDESVRCTPAIAGNRIYVRSGEHLGAFGQ
ncbi:MAG TPA: hypothetical protein PLX89_10155 [Verrucomicrobiota bacterium]|nr:hypothetical protein [Verrucomicrobiota bacterium]